MSHSRQVDFQKQGNICIRAKIDAGKHQLLTRQLFNAHLLDWFFKSQTLVVEPGRRVKNEIIAGCCLFLSHTKLFEETGRSFEQQRPREVVIRMSAVVT